MIFLGEFYNNFVEVIFVRRVYLFVWFINGYIYIVLGFITFILLDKNLWKKVILMRVVYGIILDFKMIC